MFGFLKKQGRKSYFTTGKIITEYGIVGQIMIMSYKGYLDININSNRKEVPFGEVDQFIVGSNKIEEYKNKSIIGRGIVGGVLFGPVGAIIAGMTGIGSKLKIKNKDIVYLKLSSGEEVVFETKENWQNKEIERIIKECK